MSRPDARDTGAALLITDDGALGVETPAHKDEGKRDERDGKNHGLTPETQGRRELKDRDKMEKG